MKVIMYGMEVCPDCAAALEKLAAAPTVELDFRDIGKSTASLKEFLAYRDHDGLFAPVIDAGGIGIPFFLPEDGKKTFELEDFLTPRK